MINPSKNFRMSCFIQVQMGHPLEKWIPNRGRLFPIYSHLGAHTCWQALLKLRAVPGILHNPQILNLRQGIVFPAFPGSHYIHSHTILLDGIPIFRKVFCSLEWYSRPTFFIAFICIVIFGIFELWLTSHQDWLVLYLPGNAVCPTDRNTITLACALEDNVLTLTCVW